MKFRITLFTLFLLSLLSACNDSSTENESTGTFNMSVSDAPADAQIVNIAFKQVVVKGSSGSYSFHVSDGDDDENTDDDESLRHVDLVSYQGFKVANLVSNESLPVGEYQLCIYMKNNETSGQNPDDPTSSFVKEPVSEGGAIVGLTTPSQGECGGGVGADDDDTGRLFINKKFTISEGENSYIAEFDINKVLKEPTGQDTYWTLKPTGIELFEAGSITGSISQALSDNCGSDLGHAVYLYPGPVDITDMVGFTDEGSSVAPLNRVEATLVNSDDLVQGYQFEFPAIYEGSYSLGYTCLADNDTVLEDSSAAFSIYAAEQGIKVTIVNTTTVDFDVEEP